MKWNEMKSTKEEKRKSEQHEPANERAVCTEG